MKESNRRLQPLVCVTVLLLSQYTGLCFADEVDDQSFAGLSIVENDNLEGMRAGDFDVTTTVQSIQRLEATVTGGDFQADSIKSGNITFTGGQVGGFGLTVGNSGHNNAIDAALGISFHFE